MLVVPGGSPALAQNLAAVPGVVLRSLPSPPSIAGIVVGGPRVYTTSPSIVVLPNGDYVVSDNDFGSDSNASVSGTTRTYRSTDKGVTWTQTAVLSDMKRGSLFVHAGSLYLMGYVSDNSDPAHPGQAVIRRSTDGGLSWSTPTSGTTGLLGTGGAGTPNAPVVHGGRLWVAQGGKRVRSLPLGTDPLRRANWVRTNAADTDTTSPFDDPDLVISEAQIVASPRTGVVVLPKVQSLNAGVLLRPSATDPATMIPATTADWISLPGGEKKFAARYDPVSDTFFALTNPVLPAHLGYLPNQPELVRNTAVLLASSDLRTWDVRRIFLYSPNVATEAFQYLQFDYDGDDMVVASRTAFDIGGNKPPRGHDSNLTTFHRIEDFRTAAARQQAVIADGAVLRRELTQHAPAPLGSFALGTRFESAALIDPEALGQGADGSVYVRERGGRILRFDPLGNFVDTVAAAPVPLTADPLDLAPPAEGERTWVRPAGGDWFDLNHWHYWNRPDAPHETVTFGTAITAAAEITADRTYTLAGVRFRSDEPYHLAGAGGLRLEADSGMAQLQNERGRHTISLAVDLGDDVRVGSAAGAGLTLNGPVALGGNTVTITGAGETVVVRGLTGPGELAVSGGWLRLAAASESVIGGPISVLDGTLELDGLLAGSAVTIGQGGTLMGSGTVAGTVTFGAGATLSPGGAIPPPLPNPVPEPGIVWFPLATAGLIAARFGLPGRRRARHVPRS